MFNSKCLVYFVAAAEGKSNRRREMLITVAPNTYTRHQHTCNALKKSKPFKN